MSKPELRRPFNLEHAKAGAPIATARRGNARFVAYEETADPSCCVIVIEALHNTVGTRRKNGRVNETDAHDNPYDLVMQPLGFIDGKPVFVGDELVTRFGDKFVVEVKHIGDLDEENTWPVPEPVYPEMLMSDGDLVSNYYGGGPVSHEQEYQAWRRIANAALRHAIDIGQVVLPDAAPSDDLLMKVAKEVWCRATGQEHFLNEKEQYFCAIIASVTGAKDAKEGAQ